MGSPQQRLMSDPLRADRLSRPYYGLKPPTDLSSVSSITSAVRAQVLERARLYEQWMLSARAILNSQVLINRLPDELLAEIFRIVQERSCDTSHHHLDPEEGWPRVLQVCRHWFAVGTTSPASWRHIIVKKSLDMLRIALLRSKATTVNIRKLPINSYRFPTVVPRLLFKEFVTLVGPHTHRIRKLEFESTHLHEDAPLLCSFLTGYSMPELVWLSVVIDRFGNVPVAVKLDARLSAERMPKLRELDLPMINIAQSMSIFSQLTTLKIKGRPHGVYVPTCELQDLSRMMRNLVNVVCLTLARLRVTRSSEESMADDSVHTLVELAHLRKLDISVESWVIKRLLRDVIISTAADVDIEFMNTSESPRALSWANFDRLLPNHRCCLPCLAQATHARFEGGERCVTLLSANHPRGASQSLGTTLPVSGSLTMSSHRPRAVDDDQPHWNNALRILLALPGLVALTIRCLPSALRTMRVDWKRLFASLPLLKSLSLEMEWEPNSLPQLHRGDEDDEADGDGEEDEEDGDGEDGDHEDDEVDGFGWTIPSATQIFDALNPETTEGPIEILTPQLRTLYITGMWSAAGPLAASAEACLENRATRLGRQVVLDQLSLDTADRRFGQRFDTELKEFEAAVRPFVEYLKYST
ncbi:hypothetical protein ACG7TL_008277 [Trametes sanguinea]